MTDAWDALTAPQQWKVQWSTSLAIKTLRPELGTIDPDALEDVIRFAVNAYAEVVDLQVGRFTSKAYLEDQRVRAYDSGWNDGHQAGKDEALDAIEQLAKAKADA